MSRLPIWADFMDFVEADELIFEHLKTEDGNHDMSVDGSGGIEYFYEARGDKIITRSLILIIDGVITPTKLGGISAVNNGILVEVHDSDGDLLKNFLDVSPIKKNADFSLLAGVDATVVVAAAGDDYLPIRWTLAKTGRSLLLSDGQRFVVTIQDDLSDISSMEWILQGYDR